MFYSFLDNYKREREVETRSNHRHLAPDDWKTLKSPKEDLVVPCAMGGLAELFPNLRTKLCKKQATTFKVNWEKKNANEGHSRGWGA